MKRILSIILSALISLCLFPQSSYAASPDNAQFVSKISSLRNTFRHGEYWNSKNYEATVKEKGCPETGACMHDSNAYYKTYSVKCGAFIYGGKELAWQCHGYALKLGNLVFGGNPNTWTTHSNAYNIYAGDIIRWKPGNYWHSIFVYKVEGDTIYYTDCNRKGPCRVWWGDSYSKYTISKLKSLNIYHFSGNTCTGGDAVIQKPSAPSSVTLSPADTAKGSSVTASWSGAAGTIDKYYVSVICTSNSSFNQAEKTYTGTSATINLNNAGTYKVSVRSYNSSGYSAAAKESNTIVVHNDLAVTFKDYDGRILEKKTISYGGTVSAAAVPNRAGYSFKGWKDGLGQAIFTNITTDKEFTAEYQINTYYVKFINSDGTQIGPTQRIEYGKSAVPPEATPASGYKFIGWDKKDYEFVRDNLTITAVYVWGNSDLPIETDISSAVRKSDLSGYDVKINLQNHAGTAVKGKIITMLKTEEGKMVSSEAETVYLSASTPVTKDIFVSYSGIATTAEVEISGILDDDKTGVPISLSVNKQVDLGLTWSDWSVNPPPSGSPVTESRTEYRYRDKSTTSGYSNTMAGWTLYDSKITSWGNWSPWQNNAVTANNNRQVETNTVPAVYKTVWRYERWVNSTGTWTYYAATGGCARQAIELDNRLTAIWDSSNGRYRYGAYIYGTNGSYIKNFWWNESSAQVQTAPAYTQYRYRDAIYTHYFYKWDDNKWTEWSPAPVTATADRQVETRTVYRFKNNDIKTTVYNYKRYKYQNLSDGLYYYTYNPAYSTSMGYPGGWEYNKAYSELPVIATVDNNIPVFNGYAENSWYRADVNSLGTVTDYMAYETLEDTRGKAYTVSGTISEAGKKATIMVFKGTNTDPTASQLQYVKQTTLGLNGAYSFTFKPKDEISCKNGDYIVMIGVEGATSPVYITTIKAPLPTYTVEFADEDGRILEKQTVIKGDSAALPTSNPSKEGYDFVGWDTGITNVHDDLTIKAQYVRKTYTVVFVDWQNNDIAVKTFRHGDALEGPEPAIKDGSTFKGWDAVLDGVTAVTGNMIVSAEYELNQYTISFLDRAGNIINTQVLDYGSEAALPEEPTLDGMVFAGWSDYYATSFVSRDSVVYPMFAYENTVEAPTADITSGRYTDALTVSLSCQTPDSMIYYCIADGIMEDDFSWSFDDYEWTEYGSPIYISSDSTLIFYASADEMNNSEYQIEKYAVAKPPHESSILFNGLLKANDKITGSLAIRINNPYASEPCTVTLSAYSGGMLLGHITKTVTLNTGNNDIFFENVTFSNVPSGNTDFKIMGWNLPKGMKPTVEKKEFSIKA